MYCKKCGHKQAEGEKFCPVCGTPFLDPGGKPYQKGLRKDLSDTKVKAAEKYGQASATVGSAAAHSFKTMKSVGKKVWEHKGDLEGIAKKLVKPAAFIALVIAVILIGKGLFGSKHGIGKVFKKEKSPMEQFQSTAASNAYSVTIYERNTFGGWYVSKSEVSESGIYDPSLSYVWTIVFFPDNNSHGTAAVVPFTLDKTGYAKAMEISYLYDVNGNNINLYNGQTVTGRHSRDDIHLQVEKDGDNGVMLVGHYRNKNRKFKRATFPFDREPHHYQR